ncbi:hypothetical protein BDV96DRAFT_604407 [Lophiotrema nucula]|uniref:Uncharacterized protein n=1 Tax=Lophiotrema nucula TaxID=690887 RepID=A0A6A5YS73_9PLEO|nr:hypothetical protein BDV96DRAFT_604407 [Lophiotrema nucula]
MPRRGRKPQAGRDFAPQHVVRQQLAHQGGMGMGMGMVAGPRFPLGFSSRPDRAFYQSPWAAGGENQRRIRQRVLGQHARIKQQNFLPRFGHRQGFRGGMGFGHRPVAPMMPRRQPVFPRRSPFARGYRSPLHHRPFRPMYTMNPFQQRGYFPPRGPDFFHNAGFEPRQQNFRRRPFEDDGWSDDDDITEFGDDETDYLDEYDEEEDDSYYSDYSTGFDSGYDDEYDDEGWGSRRPMYHQHGRYGSRY